MKNTVIKLIQLIKGEGTENYIIYKENLKIVLLAKSLAKQFIAEQDKISISNKGLFMHLNIVF